MGTLESTMVALAMEWGNLMAWSIRLDIKLFAIVYAVRNFTFSFVVLLKK